MNIQTGIHAHDTYTYFPKKAATPEETGKRQGSQEKILPGQQNKDAQNTKGILGQTSSQKSSGFHVSSDPSSSPGQLATTLARAKTPFDVQQVVSKAMSALTGLKIAQVLCDSKDRSKITMQIRRMEKLLIRSRTKIRLLKREAVLERQQKKAEKQVEEEKARQLQEEVARRRRRRQSDEHRYAQEELNKDLEENKSAALSAAAGSSSLGTSTGMAAETVSAAVPVSVSVEVSAPSAEISFDVQV